MSERKPLSAEDVDAEMPELVDLDENQVNEIIKPVTVEEDTFANEDDVNMTELKSIKQRKRKMESLKDENDEYKKPKPVHTNEMRRVACPPHRYGALKENWVKIITPVVKQLNMQIRYNLKTRNVEIRSPDENCNNANIQKQPTLSEHLFLASMWMMLWL
uniref:Uncharacterized protein n=1 Tax=Ditylenchus dipsaci TaxID=166011 RepID=A0A915DCS6_9BILA